MLLTSVFNSFNNKQKTEALLQQGKFLYTRYEPAYTVDTYELAGFYVEIYFHKGDAAPAVFRSFYKGESNTAFLPEEKIHYLYQDIIRKHTA